MRLSRIFLPLMVAACATPAQDGLLQPRHWAVDGVDRHALVAAPPSAKTKPSPLVFVYHGHGGTMYRAARGFHIHMLWPEAIVVYPQGLNTPGVLGDPEGKLPGWQTRSGEQGDRDFKFFDAMLASLRAEYKVDPKRVYCTGHSNGGGFTYLLWAWRGDALAAVAPSGAAVRMADRWRLKPKPVLHIAGKQDDIVQFEWQEAMISFLKKHNGSQPVETFLYDGGHAFPREASAHIVEFFRAH